jgi:hypothetical protein
VITIVALAVPRPGIELATPQISDSRLMGRRRGESNPRPLTNPDMLRPNASPVGDTRGERRCPHCGEDLLIDRCEVLMRWECAVCAKSWRADARLPREGSDITVRPTLTLDFRAGATHRKRNVGRVGSTDRRP